MSRIGKKPIIIPGGVEVNIEGREVKVKGPKGALSLVLHDHAKAEIKEEGNEKFIQVSVINPLNKADRAIWGLSAKLIYNMVCGITEGFKKELEVNGVGYKVALQGNTIKLEVGYSHPVEFALPEGISAEVQKNVITILGIDKQLVGEMAAQIRKIRKPEPYKGKGIKYSDEVIRRKAGKAAKSAG
ncbi:MAG: 50S ribosomal protein L6 [Parcubacteria group bacterium CG10_big_fil_rev_8_21_14_0_10_36_14]|nr:MAG: 50S ribosomal protein L6 [Parcubacteria group bacterium CG10_big_fil_rev_8_21_14_0_10_36_14]